MSKTKTEKAIIALQRRVETVEISGDMLARALSPEDYEETVKCAQEIKTLLTAHEQQNKSVKQLNKKVVCQKAQIKGLLKKEVQNGAEI